LWTFFAPNVSSPNFHKHTQRNLRVHIYTKTIVVGDCNTLLSPIDMSSRQKNQQRNTRPKWHYRSKGPDVYRTFHLATAQYTLFSVAHGTFSKVDHILGNKASLNKYEKVEISPCILSDHNALKLELNNKSSSRKYTNN
jgi:exonuclease III